MEQVALLVGGPSNERDVSFMSANSVKPVLLALGYCVHEIDVNPYTIIKSLNDINVDIAFNCLHGAYGEDGTLQGVLESMKIPYTHSGVSASAIGFNKAFTSSIAIQNGIRCPEAIELSTRDFFYADIPFTLIAKPYVLKPVTGGSTLGVYIVKDERDLPSKEQWRYGDRIILERFIPGVELSVAVLNGKGIGVIELRPLSGVHDYHSKYTQGATEHIIPPCVPDIIIQQAIKYAETIHSVLGCRTLSRVDLIYNPEEGEAGLYFLEINTHPGLTKNSVFPYIAAHYEISMKTIIEILLRDARCEL